MINMFSITTLKLRFLDKISYLLRLQILKMITEISHYFCIIVDSKAKVYSFNMYDKPQIASQ